jgi:uncharacterized protein YihD (DUF1040 family)
MKKLIEFFKKEWHREDNIHLRQIAERYAQRAWMDGETVRRTGEVIPKESV